MSRTRDLPLLAWSRAGISFGLGLSVLLVGGITIDDARTEFQGIPLSPLLFAFCLLVSARLFVPYYVHRIIWLAHLPLVVMAMTIFWSENQEYAAWKISNLLGSSIVATYFFSWIVHVIGWDGFLRLWLWSLLLFLFCALLYKISTGFWDREVPFLFLGPIVFARLMGLGMLFSFVAYKAKWRHLFVAVFFLAVLWTASKGPILFIVFFLFILYILFGNPGERWSFLSICASIFVVIMITDHIPLVGSLNRLEALFVHINSNLSIWLILYELDSVRFSIFKETFDLIVSKPWGVGLGNWKEHIWIYQLDYPHNLLLEIFSEAGVLLGMVVLLPFLSFLFGKHVGLVTAGAFLFLCQQVSGDLLDARYLLCFSTLVIIHLYQVKYGDAGRDEMRRRPGDRPSR